MTPYEKLVWFFWPTVRYKLYLHDERCLWRTNCVHINVTENSVKYIKWYKLVMILIWMNLFVHTQTDMIVGDLPISIYLIEMIFWLVIRWQINKRLISKARQICIWILHNNFAFLNIWLLQFCMKMHINMYIRKHR